MSPSLSSAALDAALGDALAFYARLAVAVFVYFIAMYLADKHTDSLFTPPEGKGYLCALAVVLCALLSAGFYFLPAGHWEDIDPLRGGGDFIHDAEGNRPESRQRSAWILFFIAAPASVLGTIAGVDEAAKRLRARRQSAAEREVAPPGYSLDRK